MFPLCSDYICYNLNDEKEVLQSEYQQIFKKKNTACSSWRVVVIDLFEAVTDSWAWS